MADSSSHDGFTPEEMDALIEKYEARERRQRQRVALWPVWGLFMVVSLGVLAWAAAPAVLDFALDNIDDFARSGLERGAMELVTTAIVFAALFALSGLVVALALPRSKVRRQMTGKAMKKERERLLQERELRKARRRRITRMNRQQ